PGVSTLARFEATTEALLADRERLLRNSSIVASTARVIPSLLFRATRAARTVPRKSRDGRPGAARRSRLRRWPAAVSCRRAASTGRSSRAVHDGSALVPVAFQLVPQR